MARSLNRVELIGNLGKDPEIKTFEGGGRCANLTLATSEAWKDSISGERKERTEWHRVVIYNDGLIKVAEKYLKKGAKVYIAGKLETRKWTDKESKDHYSTEVALRPFGSDLIMLDDRKESGAGSGAIDDDIPF
jgi:single-strand DNA-binding protein